jgi:hypothetical protein
MPLSKDQLRAFAARGHIVVPNVVGQPLIDRAMARIDRTVQGNPPPADRRGFHFYWEPYPTGADPIAALFEEGGALDTAGSLIAPQPLQKPEQVQISLNIPIWTHRPGGPHLDGLTPTEPSGRPGTFTMLAGVFLTDQAAPDMGNLWVWPGSHHVAAAHLREHGPDALLQLAHPTYAMAPPEQVVGRAGDLLLAHYLLGHNMGGNISDRVRRVVYLRLHAEGHRARWPACVQDPLLEFAPVRAAMAHD